MTASGPGSFGDRVGTEPLRVGIVGANAERSWAKDAHVPAIVQLPGLVLAAVATRTAESARQAAQAFGAPLWFADATALARSDDVDIVAVCVKVPEHRAVVLSALAAGKHVYCEWPLGRSVHEADELASAAELAGTHQAIGLQGRAAPAVRRAHELLSLGAIGRPLTAQILSTTAGYGPSLPSAYAYLNDPASGANLSTILGGHTLDLAQYLLGAIVEFKTMSSIQFPAISLIDTGEAIARMTPDQLFVLSRHEGGCLLSTEIGGNRPAGTPFTFEIIGSEGTLRLLGGHPHGFQAGGLSLELNGVSTQIDAPCVHGGLLDAASNVAEVYASLVRDIREATWLTPGFREAAQLTALIDVVTRAGEGIR